ESYLPAGSPHAQREIEVLARSDGENPDLVYRLASERAESARGAGDEPEMVQEALAERDADEVLHRLPGGRDAATGITHADVAAGRAHRGIGERGDQELDRVAVVGAVGVEVDDDVAARDIHPEIARGALSAADLVAERSRDEAFHAKLPHD